jgi:hypothetical protein
VKRIQYWRQRPQIVARKGSLFVPHAMKECFDNHEWIFQTKKIFTSEENKKMNGRVVTAFYKVYVKNADQSGFDSETPATENTYWINDLFSMTIIIDFESSIIRTIFTSLVLSIALVKSQFIC